MDFYINKGDFDSQKKNQKIYELMKNDSTTLSDRDITMNSLSAFLDYFSNSNIIGKIKIPPLMMIRAFLISVYIYYQNKNSPLIKSIEKKGNNNNNDDLYYEYLPFVYDLNFGCIEGRYANIIIAPIRIEPRIENIILTSNNLRENGLFEMSKTLLINKKLGLWHM